MAATAILSIFNQADSYIFSLALPTDLPLHPQQSIHAPSCVGGVTTLDAVLQGQLTTAIDATVERLRRLYGLTGRRRRGKGGEALEQLGRFLFRVLLPAVVQDVLLDLPEGLPLLLSTNDTTLPWELLHDGRQYLALQRPLGRCLSGMAVARRNLIPDNDKRSFLFVANPSEDLDEADIEVERLIELFEPELIAGARPKFLARRRATTWEVLQALGAGYDIIHYSGHAEEGRLLLANGHLTTTDIQITLSGRPFVFLNACYSASSASDLLDALPFAGLTARNLASAFIMGGAVGFIGTLWPVFDASSRQFAEWFYSHVRHGMTVGQALRRTRLQMYEAQPDDPIWASFVFYGDPQLKITALVPPETRSVTVLTAQLTGLLPLFEQLRLERAAKIRQELLTVLRRISQRFSGLLHGPLNQCLTIYFGIPKANGKETKHAIHVALNMIEALQHFNEEWRQELPTPLRLHFGISSGRVLVESTEKELQLTGQVEGIAGLLAHHSDLNQVVIDEATYRQIREQFACQRLVPLEMTHGEPLKRLERYAVLNSPVEQRLRQLVGREDELAQLQRWWNAAIKAQGRVVALVGAAGIGKSALKGLFLDQIIESKVPHQWIGATCHIYEETQSYGLLAQIVRALAAIERHDDEATQRGRLTALLHSLGRPSEARIKEGLGLLGRVVGLPYPLPPLDNLEPKLRQRKLSHLVVTLLRSQATQQPLVLALEDLQWVDEASLNVLDKIVNSTGRMRILLLTTYRPEWSHEWSKLNFYKHISLDELSKEAQHRLLSNLLGTTPAEELAEAILSRTGGNPFFIEEVVWSLQEQNLLLRRGEAWLPATDINQLPLPDTVEHVIQARLDRLSPESRRLLQTAAVVGQTFEHEVLEGVQDNIEHSQLDNNLERLTSHNLIYALGGWPFFYSFQHGLVHQAAYNLLPEGLRAVAHRLIAQALRHVYDEETIIERLAHHYYHSSDRLNAISYGLRAAKEQADDWANQTALDWYERLLEKLDSFERVPLSEREQLKGVNPTQLLKWRIEALEGQADVYITLGKSDQAIASYQEALTLAVEMPISSRGELYRKLAIAYQYLGLFQTAQQAVDNGLALLNQTPPLSSQESTLLGQLHVYTGFLDYRRGELAQGLIACERGLSILKQTSSQRELAQAYNLQGIFYRNLGQSQQALEAYGQSIRLYQETDYLPGEVWASFNQACVYKDLGKWHEGLHAFEQSIKLSHRTGEVRREAAALNNQAEIYRRQGKLEEAISAYHKALQIVKELGFEELIGIISMNLGGTYLKKKEPSPARQMLAESLAIFERLKANMQLPEVKRYLAELALMNDRPTNALQLAQQAVDWAVKLKRSQEEGPARRILGKVYHELGQIEEARQELKQSLSILEGCNIPYEMGLTLLALSQLAQSELKNEPQNKSLREQAIDNCTRAISIFKQLGAALDLERAQETATAALTP